MPSPPRVAFFPDSFHEVNGVAHTSRNFVAYARRRRLPFLSVRAGASKTPVTEIEGDHQSLELGRSRISIPIERDLHFDLLFGRHLPEVGRALDRFRPDLIHITGPSELGILGAYFAHKLRLPLAAAWQTNLHEYVPMRLNRVTRILPGGYGSAADRRLEAASFSALLRFYRMAGMIFAPNAELCDQLAGRLNLPCHIMRRGIDTASSPPLAEPGPRPTAISSSVMSAASRSRKMLPCSPHWPTSSADSACLASGSSSSAMVEKMAISALA